jgi:WD40 repeat protein
MLCFTGHRKLVSELCFVADTALLVSASWDKVIRIWDAVVGSSLIKLEGFYTHSSFVVLYSSLLLFYLFVAFIFWNSFTVFIFIIFTVFIFIYCYPMACS